MTNRELIISAKECSKRHDEEKQAGKEYQICEDYGCWSVLQAYRAGVEDMRDAVVVYLFNQTLPVPILDPSRRVYSHLKLEQIDSLGILAEKLLKEEGV